MYYCDIRHSTLGIYYQPAAVQELVRAHPRISKLRHRNTKQNIICQQKVTMMWRFSHACMKVNHKIPSLEQL